VHYARATCVECDRWITFLKKPDSDPTKYRRPTQHRKLVDKFSNGYCELCLRRQEDLPKGETLHAHHVHEYQDGGEAKRENIWIVCTACHSLINWRRTYEGHVHDLATKMTEAVRNA
jgi:5-methylcytosine-specific restriction endonuclease McrA